MWARTHFVIAPRGHPPTTQFEPDGIVAAESVADGGASLRLWRPTDEASVPILWLWGAGE